MLNFFVSLSIVDNNQDPLLGEVKIQQLIMLHPEKKCVLDDYLSIEKSFSDFIDYLSSLVCPQKCHTQFSGDVCNYRTKWKNHNKGALVRILADGPRIDSQSVLKWSKDVEHGLFHGVMTAFIAMMFKHPDGIPEHIFEEQTSSKINTAITADERIVVTCLVHDFVKSSFEKEPHDFLLKDYFYNLSDIVYSHSSPKDINELIVADRWELLRYPNWKDWVDFDMLNHFSHKTTSMLIAFYSHLRPALEKMIFYKDDVWFRHSPERMWVNDSFPNLNSHSNYPPKGFWPARQDNEDYFAVEIGTMPPKACLIHGYTKNNSSTDTDAASYSPYGMINLLTLNKFANKDDYYRVVSPCVRVDPDDSPGSGTKPPKWSPERHLGDNWSEDIRKTGYSENIFISREHLCVQGQVPLKEWIFLYDDNRDTQYGSKERINRDWPNLFVNSKGVVNLHLACNFIELLKQLEVILLSLRF